jgi:hypothetical protein
MQIFTEGFQLKLVFCSLFAKMCYIVTRLMLQKKKFQFEIELVFLTKFLKHFNRLRCES